MDSIDHGRISVPNVSAAIVNEFVNTFSGHSEYYGVSIPTGNKTEKGKLVMRSYTKSTAKGDKELSQTMYREHLEGKKGLGISPINFENNCRFGVLDIDDYDIEPQFFMEISRDYDLPFCLFRSKSGGLHCYIFFSEDTKASSVRDIMRKFILLFGLNVNTEIFPKQEKLFNSSSPSWINLPYFGGTDSYMYDRKCEKMPLELALMEIVNKKVTWETLKSKYEGLPLNDGPICLQSLFLRSDYMVDGDGRNNYLFNMGIYYKSSDSVTFEDNILMANNKLKEPKEESKIVSQIINPIQKKTYSYRCSDHPLCENCNVDLCKERKFGKGGDEISSLSFEELKQVKTNPPYYLWMVNGHEMVFYKESELREQQIFADQCMRMLHVVPNTIKRQRWIEILNKAFKEIVIEDVDPADDMSPGSLLWDYFVEYIMERPKAQSREQIKAGYIYYDSDKSIYVFKKKMFLQFLQLDKNFRFFGPTEVQKRLFDNGVGTKVYRIAKGSVERVWYVYKRTVLKEHTVSLENNRVDFSDMKPKEQEF